MINNYGKIHVFKFVNCLYAEFLKFSILNSSGPWELMENDTLACVVY